MTMLPAANAASNGHGPGDSLTSSGIAPVPVPEAAQVKLRLLIDARNEAQLALSLYFKSLMVVLDLPPDSDWDLSDDLEVLTPHIPQA